MQIHLYPSVLNSNSKCQFKSKQDYSTPLSFCGADAFERSSVKFSKELCIKTIDMLLTFVNNQTNIKKKLPLEISKTLSALKNTDPELIKLNKLAAKYKKTLSLEDKKMLLKHELKMHRQELETPEIGLVRTYSDMIKCGYNKDFIPIMKVSTITGLNMARGSLEKLGVKSTPNKKYFNSLKKILEETPDDYPFAAKIKSYALGFASELKTNKVDFLQLAKHVKENTSNKELEKYANSLIPRNLKYNESVFFEKLLNRDLQDFEKIAVIETLAKNKSKKLTAQLPTMIKEKNISHSLQLTAIWAAGKCKSCENFDLLYKIANDNSSKNLESREIALHSLALYLRTNTSQVKETLNNVIKEKSDLSELAYILLEKTEGRYYVKDRELVNLTVEEKRSYKEMRNKYVQSSPKLNIQHQNIVDRALSPFFKILSGLVGDRLKFSLTDDTLTRFEKGSSGIRKFYADSSYAGFFADAIFGISTKKRIIVNKSELKNITKQNVLAHEFNHTFLKKVLSEDDSKKLESLYEKAVEQNKCIDFYSRVDEREYFAQGYEAYTSVYKPHSAIIDSLKTNAMDCSVRSKLKRKDPELYCFIEYCIAKYS